MVPVLAHSSHSTKLLLGGMDPKAEVAVRGGYKKDFLLSYRYVTQAMMISFIASQEMSVKLSQDIEKHLQTLGPKKELSRSIPSMSKILCYYPQ